MNHRPGVPPEPCPRNSILMALSSWGACPQSAVPPRHQPGLYRETAPAQSEQPFTFAFYPVGQKEGRAEVSCPVLAFRLLRRKEPSQSLGWDLCCATQGPSCSPTSPSSPTGSNVHPQLLISTGARSAVRHQHSEGRTQIAHGPSDMFVTDCQLCPSAQDKQTLCVPALLTALLTWGLHKGRGSWGQWAVPDSSFNI